MLRILYFTSGFMIPDPLESALCQGDHDCGPLLEL
jgi:hypothetical protein